MDGRCDREVVCDARLARNVRKNQILATYDLGLDQACVLFMFMFMFMTRP